MGCRPSKAAHGQQGTADHAYSSPSSSEAAVAVDGGVSALNFLDSSLADGVSTKSKKAGSLPSDRHRGASFGSADSSGGVNSLSTSATPIGARRSSRGSSMPMLRSDGPPYLVAATRQARLAYIVLRSFVLQDWTTADRLIGLDGFKSPAQVREWWTTRTEGYGRVTTIGSVTVGAGGYATAPVRFSRGLKQLVVRHSWHPSGTGADPWDPSVRDVVQEITLRDGPFKNFLDLSRALGPACTVVLPSPHMESAGDCLTHTPIDPHTWQVSGPWVCPSTAPSTPDALSAVEGHLNRSWLAHTIISRLHRAAAKAGLAKGRASFTSVRSTNKGGGSGVYERRPSRRGSAPSPALLAMAAGEASLPSASVAKRGGTNSTATETVTSPVFHPHRRSHSSPDLLHQAMIDGATSSLAQAPFSRGSLEQLTLPGPALGHSEGSHSRSGGNASEQHSHSPLPTQDSTPVSPTGASGGPAASRISTLASDEGGPTAGGSFRSKKRLRRPSARHSIISILSDGSAANSSLAAAVGHTTPTQRMPHERLLADWAVWAAVADVPSAVGPEGHVLPPLTGSCSTQLMRRNSLTPGVYTPKWEHLAPPRLRSRTTSARNTWGMFRALSGAGAPNSKASRVSEAWLDEVTSMELAMHESGVAFSQSIVLPIAPVDTLRVRVPNELLEALANELEDVRDGGSGGLSLPPRVMQLFVVTAPALESWTLMDVQPVVDAPPVLGYPSPPLSPPSAAGDVRHARHRRRGSGPASPTGWVPAPISVISEEDTSKGLTHSAASSGSSHGLTPTNRGRPSGSYATDTSAEKSPPSSGIKVFSEGSSKERNHSAPELVPATSTAMERDPVSSVGQSPIKTVEAQRKSSLASTGSDDDTSDEEDCTASQQQRGKQARPQPPGQPAARQVSPVHAGLNGGSAGVKMRGDLRHLADIHRNEIDLIALAASRPANGDEDTVNVNSSIRTQNSKPAGTLPQTRDGGKPVGVRFSPPTHRTKPSPSGDSSQYSICELKFSASVPAVLVRFLWRVHEPGSHHQAGAAQLQ